MNKILTIAAVTLFVCGADAFADEEESVVRRRRNGPSILELAFAEQNQDEVDSALAELENEGTGNGEQGTSCAKVTEDKTESETGEQVTETSPEPQVQSPAIQTIVVTNVIERIVEVEKPVVVTNTIERVVERQVADKEMQDRVDFAEAVNTDLSERNERLEEALKIERERRERLERVIPKNKLPKTGRPAKITSANTFFDRKEGVAMFDRNVHVDDETFQMWADKAYVFMEGTNDVRRIVAIGNVALTNEARRAYGTKASYYKEGGMVVLYGDAERPAEVRDESKVEDQTVKGSKIKFWIDSEQLQVIDADISAPVQGGSTKDFKQVIGK